MMSLTCRCMCVCVCVCVCAQLCSALCNPWTVACQAPLFMEYSRQEYHSGMPFPPPGDLPNPGIQTTFLGYPALAGRFFTTEPPGKPLKASANESICKQICVQKQTIVYRNRLTDRKQTYRRGRGRDKLVVYD